MNSFRKGWGEKLKNYSKHPEVKKSFLPNFKKDKIRDGTDIFIISKKNIFYF